ncbi:hypothetical protein CC86DRAFT_24208 [Ophiobolus disseminans]|uniref:Secreted protein n=1 Tax=Ophiobolus disseminans TaxID=1469910 RepID=A0A6A7A1B0_9PLEO|nr:hypothetical protein CC86DRAFT_24208 [Ophiobolus disseminans]
MNVDERAWPWLRRLSCALCWARTACGRWDAGTQGTRNRVAMSKNRVRRRCIVFALRSRRDADSRFCHPPCSTSVRLVAGEEGPWLAAAAASVCGKHLVGAQRGPEMTQAPQVDSSTAFTLGTEGVQRTLIPEFARTGAMSYET